MGGAVAPKTHTRGHARPPRPFPDTNAFTHISRKGLDETPCLTE